MQRRFKNPAIEKKPLLRACTTQFQPKNEKNENLVFLDKK